MYIDTHHTHTRHIQTHTHDTYRHTHTRHTQTHTHTDTRIHTDVYTDTHTYVYPVAAAADSAPPLVL